MKLREAAPALAVFVLALAYLLLLRPYGFQLEDEGTLLFWFSRVADGQRPYVDFHTGYTPGFFAFGSTVFALFGASATSLRGVLALINATTAAGLAEITRRVAGERFAWIAPLIWLLFVPVYPGEFAAFNVPYPTWPVTLAWVVLALAMLSWVERRRASTLVVAGAAAAAMMWFRPNSGAFALAAATWIVAATAARRSVLDRIAAPLAAAAMALGVWYTFEFRVAGMDAFVHLVPAMAVAVLCAGPLSARFSDNDAPGATIAMAMLGAAFLAPTLSWTLPLLAELGRDRFLYEVFLVGAGYQSLYYKPHPAPEIYALAVTAAALAFAIAGRLVAARRLNPLVAIALFGACAIGGGAWLLHSEVMPEGFLQSVSLQLENASFWLAIVANFGAVSWLAQVSRQASGQVSRKQLALSSRARALAVLTPLSVAMYLQMFPRSDFMHQVTSVPLTAVVACALLWRVVSWWAGGDWPEGWNGRNIVGGAAACVAASVLVVAAVEKTCGPLEAWSSQSPSGTISSQLDVHVEAAAGDELQAIAQTVDFLRRHSDGGEALWSFPATSGLLFAAGRRNAAPHDYWYPGRPDHAEEGRVLGLLREKKPRLVVTLNRGWDFFADSPLWFEDLRAWTVFRYRLVARFGRYDVLARRELPGFDEIATSAQGVGDSKTAEAEAIEPNLERRRQAAARWMDVLTPADAAAASLPSSRRDCLLLLRALRDGGDLRAAAWAIQGYESSDPRVRSEAVDAMNAMVRDVRARRRRFANDFDGSAWKPYVAALTDGANTLKRSEDARAFADEVLAIAGTPQDR
ncbi:MAG TPA: glycosyltransferase family 39 protein [Candidatus Binatia bacterium]|jgi:hypothetical protein